MLVKEIYSESLKKYEEGVAKGTYALSERDIKILAQADFYRRIIQGEGGCSLETHLKAEDMLMQLRLTEAYIEAEDKLFTEIK